VLAFEREGEGEKLLCLFNLGRHTATAAVPGSAHATEISCGDVSREGGTVTLGARSGAVFTL